VTVGISVDAHRLDEYLQATRVTIDLDRITLEIDLTAGTSLAANVIGWMDTDEDGQLSAAERAVYAQQVIDSVTLALDGTPRRLALVDSQFPEIGEIEGGTGTVRLRAAASVPAIGSGRHVLTYFNSHHREASVYLANAMVPGDNRITIASQQRDSTQNQLTLEYDVSGVAWQKFVLPACAVVILAARSGILGRMRRRRQQSPVTSRIAC
jgi:hypothetical protein